VKEGREDGSRGVTGEREGEDRVTLQRTLLCNDFGL
jgi:hypothetical protein